MPLLALVGLLTNKVSTATQALVQLPWAWSRLCEVWLVASLGWEFL